MEMLISVEGDQYEALRVFCIGRNYAAHIEELKSERLEAPTMFSKPPTSLVPPGTDIRMPVHGNDLQHEAEVVVLIGKEGAPKDQEEATGFIRALSLGLDMTLRDVQRVQKEKGLPWEIAKSFDQSAPIGTFSPYNDTFDLGNIPFSCHVNGELRQQGNTGDMIFPIPAQVLGVSRIWRLLPGDLIYTGTPAGVGSLKPGDTISVESELMGPFSWNIR
ncbi:MAG: fumarylacetoacetate hydrolase family protein [Deltaproteobacteria bacterium]|nr:fumarylacetoacetate hydrolase family protein [Deltaproteobacteria bacterium]MBW1941900.1 fumarylacetoacetate hydrolase family protein [Deltaproteobacteria bacterium]